MFSLQLEQDGEVLIPAELNQNDLPISFRYYDPIINESRRRFPNKLHELNTYKNTMRIGYHKNETVLTKVLEFIGTQQRNVTNQNESTQRLSLRHSILNPIVTNDFDYHLSTDCKEIQRSKYMAIDEDLERLDGKFTIMGLAATKELQKSTIVNGGGPRVNK